MDPDRTLTEILTIMASGEPTSQPDGPTMVGFAEHVRALHEWLASGGKPPAAWVGLHGTNADLATVDRILRETDEREARGDPDVLPGYDDVEAFMDAVRRLRAREPLPVPVALKHS